MPYPTEILEQLKRLPHAGAGLGDAFGTDANFRCGSFVRFRLDIDSSEQLVRLATFSSSGCGWMVASAEKLCESVSGKHLTELHGLSDLEMSYLLETSFGAIDAGRRACVAAAINAIRSAFADFRWRQIEEFRGERALICTCFGVTEETIENAIESKYLTSVEAVAGECNAGSGCGSCRMLIQEMIDTNIW